MKKKLFISLVLLMLVAAPVLTLAAPAPFINPPAGTPGTTGGIPTTCAQRAALIGVNITDIQSFICKLNELLGTVLPFLIALAVLYFVWGVITYIIGGDEEKKSEGRSRMIYGLIGLAVILGVWTLVGFITNTFGLDNKETITFPTVPY